MFDWPAMESEFVLSNLSMERPLHVFVFMNVKDQAGSDPDRGDLSSQVSSKKNNFIIHIYQDEHIFFFFTYFMFLFVL